jgi:4-amino-4-deoxy-L-arabinose transferase-like glycosyltransferase
MNEVADNTPARPALSGPAVARPALSRATAGRRALLLLFAACVTLRAVSLFRPCLSDDEATYCVVGREMLTGHVLYRDVVDHKPPLIYVTYAVTQALGGPNGGMILLHALTILVVFATALLLRAIARRFAGMDETAAFFAALLYVVFTTTLLDFDSLAANCELFMLLPLTASVYVFLSAWDELRPLGMLCAGLLTGVAILYKYQGGIHLPLYGVALVAAGVRGKKLARALGSAALVGMGCLAALAICGLIMSRDGSLQAAIFWFRFNFAYIKEGLSPGEVAGRALIRVPFVIVSAALLYGLAGHSLRRMPRTRFFGFLVGWIVVSALCVTVGGRFFGHYFHQLTAPLAVAGAPSAAALWKAGRRVLVGVGLAVPAAAFFLIGLFHGPIMALAGHPDPDYPAIAAFIDQNSGPGDPMVIWGNSPVLYFDADRPLGCRFVFSNYLSGLSPATRTQSDPNADASANVVPESWDMFAADLAARRPVLFVDASPGNIGDYGKFPPSHYPELEAILDRDYEPLATIDGARILRRRN